MPKIIIKGAVTRSKGSSSLPSSSASASTSSSASSFSWLSSRVFVAAAVLVVLMLTSAVRHRRSSSAAVLVADDKNVATAAHVHDKGAVDGGNGGAEAATTTESPTQKNATSPTDDTELSTPAPTLAPTVPSNNNNSTTSAENYASTTNMTETAAETTNSTTTENILSSTTTTAEPTVAPTTRGGATSPTSTKFLRTNNAAATNTPAPVASAAVVSSPSSSSRRFGVFCFGDSLTSGMAGHNFYPYADPLRDALVSFFPAASSSESSEQEPVDDTPPRNQVVVRHLGFPGWTAYQLRLELDHPDRGLRTAIQLWRKPVDDEDGTTHLPPPLDVVVLLAGTNDLGRRRDQPATVVAEDIIALHQACLELQVPRTIAVAIPSSRYQTRSANARELAAAVNQILQNWAAGEPRTTFVEFPFAFDEHSGNWYRDGLHLSERGYQVLGEALAPTVAEVLQSLP